mmetsp:Transcript_9685/g.9993  ORF Transcript_9685/g.9993 Transcript_9685/m.9993 type:complete len:391 (-) Transcript_9685:43-1215(-)
MNYDNPALYIGKYQERFANPIAILTSENLDDVKDFILKQKTLNEKTKVLVTHSGCFHADEVLAVMMARYLKAFSSLVLVRTRNKNIFSFADMIVDVGDIFDPNTLRYDHHMSSFTEVYDSKYSSVKMSAAGLVFKYHGKEIIRSIVESWKEDTTKNYEKEFNSLVEENEEVMVRLLYEKFIHYVDGVDNGVNQYALHGSHNNHDKNSIQSVYSNNTGYSCRISRLNPNNLNKGDQSGQFQRAILLAEDEFIHHLSFLVFTHLPSYNVVLKSVSNRKNIHESGRVLYIEEEIPWKEHLNKIEEEQNLKNEILFVIGKTKLEGFRVFTVPLFRGSFDFRKGLCKEWRGKREDELKAVSKINDIKFVHNSGFIGGAHSYESALKMVVNSMLEK